MFDPISYAMGKAAGGGGGGVTPLPYIASTGAGEYIDTEYKVTDNTVIISSLEVASDNQIWASPWGVMEGPGVAECIFYVKNNGVNKCFFCWGGNSNSYNFTSYYGKPITVRHCKGQCNVLSGNEGVLIAGISSSGSASTTYPLLLFTTDSNGAAITTSHICTMKLYSFDIYEGTTLVRMFRPALDENGVPGLIELVAGKFYYNKGAGGFVYPT